MKHIESGQLVDYLRGLLDRETAAEVSAHLDVGCRPCLRAAVALRRVSDLASIDTRAELADGVVRSVKALFAVRQADRLPARRRLILRPVEGGAPVPVPVGVRSGEAAPYFSFSGGGLRLEIALLPPPGRAALRLHGELVDRERGHLAGVPAFLMSGAEIVSRATTDELGSFSMRAETDRARLFLVLDDDRLIELELGVLSDGG